MQKIWLWAKLWFRAIAIFLAYVAGLWTAFRFIFQFSDLQAFGLALALAVAIDIAGSRKKRLRLRFERSLVNVDFRLQLRLGHVAPHRTNSSG